jgi:Fe-S-cluster containining protein
MKTIDQTQQDVLLRSHLGDREVFFFRCHEGLDCFTRCCRNLNLFLYPYDVLRLKNRLGITSGAFLDRHVDVVLRESNYLPDVLLAMNEDKEKTCPFLTDRGCTVYPDRPDTCRTFPLEQGILFEGPKGQAKDIYFYKPPDFCLGRHEAQEWTARTWEEDQGAVVFHRMTAEWAEIKALFRRNPWGPEGPSGKRARMAFMATYNLDGFREFVFASSFLKRYKVKQEVLKRITSDEVALMRFGFQWVKLFVWGIETKSIRPR